MADFGGLGERQDDRRLAMISVVFSAVMLMFADGRVVQTNSAGDNVHVIDPATNQVVGTIEDIEVPHGVAIARDGGGSTSPMNR